MTARMLQQKLSGIKPNMKFDRPGSAVLAGALAGMRLMIIPKIRGVERAVRRLLQRVVISSFDCRLRRSAK